MKETGWVWYKDTQHSESNPLLVVGPTLIANNGVGTIQSERPKDLPELWSPERQRFPGYSGDAVTYSIRLRTRTALSLSATPQLTVSLDIGGAIGVIAEESKLMRRDCDQWSNYSFVFVAYQLDTWEANGARPWVSCDSLSAMEIASVDFLVVRNHRAAD